MENVPAACSRCSHRGESHIHDDRLSCAQCALSPQSHAAGLACRSYTMPALKPWAGASCLARGCDCAERGGYSPTARSGS